MADSIVVTLLNRDAVRRWLERLGFDIDASQGAAKFVARGNGQSLVFGPGTVLAWDRAARRLTKRPAAA